MGEVNSFLVLELLGFSVSSLSICTEAFITGL